MFDDSVLGRWRPNDPGRALGLSLSGYRAAGRPGFFCEMVDRWCGKLSAWTNANHRDHEGPNPRVPAHGRGHIGPRGRFRAVSFCFGEHISDHGGFFSSSERSFRIRRRQFSCRISASFSRIEATKWIHRPSTDRHRTLANRCSSGALPAAKITATAGFWAGEMRFGMSWGAELRGSENRRRRESKAVTKGGPDPATPCNRRVGVDSGKPGCC